MKVRFLFHMSCDLSKVVVILNCMSSSWSGFPSKVIKSEKLPLGIVESEIKATRADIAHSGVAERCSFEEPCKTLSISMRRLREALVLFSR